MTPSKAGMAKTRFLLVEDEEGARYALEKILRTYGHDVTSVEDGDTAIETFVSKGGFDVVLTDLSLPGTSGWDVARAIRSESPGTPVVVLSGWDIDADDANIADSGVSMVLSKPVRVKDMLSMISKLLGKDPKEGGKK